MRLPCRVQGAIYPASTSPCELVTVMVSLRRTRPARGLQSRVVKFVIATNPAGWHVCTASVKHAADLDLTVARTGSHGAAGRTADAPMGQWVGEILPKESR